MVSHQAHHTQALEIRSQHSVTEKTDKEDQDKVYDCSTFLISDRDPPTTSTLYTHISTIIMSLRWLCHIESESLSRLG